MKKDVTFFGKDYELELEIEILDSAHRFFWMKLMDYMRIHNTSSISLTIERFAAFTTSSIDIAKAAIDDLVSQKICSKSVDDNGVVTLYCPSIDRRLQAQISLEEKRAKARDKKRLQRERKKAMGTNEGTNEGTNVGTNVGTTRGTEKNKTENAPTPLKEKTKKEFEENIERITNACACVCEEEKTNPPPQADNSDLPLFAETTSPVPVSNTTFKPKVPYPQSPEEVYQYVDQLRNAGRFSEGASWTMADAESFFGHYAANGWKRGNVPIVDWQGLLYSWNGNRINRNGMQKQEMERRTAVDKERIAKMANGGVEPDKDGFVYNSEGRRCVRIRGQLVPVNQRGEPMYFIAADGSRIGNTKYSGDYVFDAQKDFDEFQKSRDYKRKHNLTISEEKDEFTLLGHWVEPGYRDRENSIRKFFEFYQQNPHYNEGTEALTAILAKKGWSVEEALEHTIKNVKKKN